jgi:glycosyltransferase involved in cell wall biosynthesis
VRVAILSYTFPRGMGYIANMLPRHLARLGAEVHYLTMDLPHYFQNTERIDSYGGFQGSDVVSPGTVEPVDGFTLHGLGHRRVFGQMRYIGLGAKLAAIRPDVVQPLLAVGWPALEAAWLQPRLGFRLFTTNHTTASVFPLAQNPGHAWSPARIRNFATRFAPGRAISLRTVKCYAGTVDCADVAVRFFGVEPHKIEVAPLGVDTDLFRPVRSSADAAERAALRAELGIADGEIVMIYTGQFTAAKNPLLLAQAVERLRSAGHVVRGLFIGNGPQADAIRELPASVVRAFMPNADLPRYYRAVEVGVWPTQESTSMLDAAACGLPIVVNDSLQAVERIAGNGLKYRLNDLTDLVAVLTRLLEPGLRAALGGAGAIRMARQFSWSDLAARRLADYQAAVAVAGRPA